MFKNSEIAPMITSGLTRFVNAMMRYTNSDAVVKSVDKTKFTCVLTLNQGNTDVFDVPLRVLIGSQASFIEIPKQGTNAIVCFLDHNMSRPKLLECHEVDEIIITVGNSVLDIKDGLFSFNGGENGGMALVANLVQKYNQLEKDLNTLKTAFSSWVVVPNDGGAALKASTTTWSSQQLTLTQQSDIENDKIKQ